MFDPDRAGEIAAQTERHRDEPVFPDYDVVTSEELDAQDEHERKRAQAVVDRDAEAAWQLMTPDEREAAFRRAIRRARGPVKVVPGDRPAGVGASATKIAKSRRRAKAARAARKRNRAR